MTNEQILTDYMQKHYTDEKLAALLAHAQDGKLAFDSCCCFIGVATADHALRGEFDYRELAADHPHYIKASNFADARDAELAFLELSKDEGDDERRAKLIPLILAEISRRDALKAEDQVPEYSVMEMK